MTYFQRTDIPTEKRFQMVHIRGNHLERLGIKNIGGCAIIDRAATPKVGDVVYCTLTECDMCGFIKLVKRIEVDTVIVGSAFMDRTQDYETEAYAILGVVLSIYGGVDGFIKYVRPKGGK